MGWWGFPPYYLGSSFGVARIIHVVPGKIYTAIVFRANKILSTRYKFSQDDGSLAGNAPASYNFETGQSSTGMTAASQPGSGGGGGGAGGEGA